MTPYAAGGAPPACLDWSAAHLPMISGGDRIEAVGRERYAVRNPANGRLVGSAPLATTEDAARALASARAALDAWRATAVAARADAIERGLDAVSARTSDLAVLLTQEHGKPLDESLVEVAAFVERMRTMVRLARSTVDGRVPTLPSARAASGRRATGPCTGVTVGLVAWNFPVGLLAKKIGPALLAGGVAVVKPAFTTPLATLRIVDLMNAAGLPAGVLSCITGRGEDVGAALATDPSVGRVHLTGSDATGREIARQARATGPELFLELAGSDPMIVCADADLPEAVRAAVAGRYRNAGQVCTAIKRLYVASEIYDAFVLELAALVRLREAGDGLMAAAPPRVRMGPLHTAAQRDRIEEQLADAVRQGSEVLVGGHRPASAACRQGSFFEATVVAHGARDSRLLREEVFGPVLPVVRTHSLDDAIEAANRSQWDLNASIWTRDRATARGAGLRLRCRQLWINRLPLGFGRAV